MTHLHQASQDPEVAVLLRQFQQLLLRYSPTELTALLNSASSTDVAHQPLPIRPGMPNSLVTGTERTLSPGYSSSASVAYSSYSPADGLPQSRGLPRGRPANQKRPTTLGGSPIGRRSGQGQFPAASSRPSSRSSTTPYENGAPYECPFCLDWSKAVPLRVSPIKRVNDLKRHIERDHHGNKIWACPAGGCGAMFDVRKAYEAHAKAAHQGRDGATPAVAAARDVGFETCPQVVFACGFENCESVYDAAAPEQGGADRTARAYRQHVAGHFQGRSAPSRWSYGRLLRNLVVHVAGGDSWKDAPQEFGSTAWNPDPASSLVLKKMLETGHLVDGPHLAECVTALAAGGLSAEQVAGLAVPKRDRCRLHGIYHGDPAAPGPDHSHYSHAGPLGGAISYVSVAAGTASQGAVFSSESLAVGPALSTVATGAWTDPYGNVACMPPYTLGMPAGPVAGSAYTLPSQSVGPWTPLGYSDEHHHPYTRVFDPVLAQDMPQHGGSLAHSPLTEELPTMGDAAATSAFYRPIADRKQASMSEYSPPGSTVYHDD
ncbi:hypothetical protein NKR23_g4661 [Pleurostoma richardsiae]|uniref:C2H2-type domain-containing protein n=1 Tax=Pleurostoma richardsiae TaxID=41990 RepID=A0AA38RVN7_9PEZI|nr:hypothetical protein NKR23_g4661 [Pleurostoma richardsiae]